MKPEEYTTPNLEDAFNLIRIFLHRNPNATIVDAAIWAKGVQDSDKDFVYADKVHGGKSVLLRDVIEKIKEKIKNDSDEY
jgi:hypothetical protein